MKWVEVKMRELGVLSHPDYKVALKHAYRATCRSVSIDLQNASSSALRR